MIANELTRSGDRRTDATETTTQSRAARQAAYPRAYRAEQKRRRTPSRDDVARVLLHRVITLLLHQGEHERLIDLRDDAIRLLAEQGFDREGAKWRFDDLIDRYEDGWQPQRKPHLQRRDADAGPG